MPGTHLNHRPIIPRTYRYGHRRWRGYVGDDRPGYSYGLCPSNHRTQRAALECARALARTWPSALDRAAIDATP